MEAMNINNNKWHMATNNEQNSLNDLKPLKIEMYNIHCISYSHRLRGKFHTSMNNLTLLLDGTKLTNS